jgi:hypothetical protein
MVTWPIVSAVAKACIKSRSLSAELVADRGYGSKALREWLAERGTMAIMA